MATIGKYNVNQENTIEYWDSPWYVTQKHCYFFV